MSINPNVIPEQTNASSPSSARPIVLSEILEALGRRSFVPFIAVPALLGLTPIGSSLLFTIFAGLLFVWVGVQLLFGRACPTFPSRFAYVRVNSRLANYVTVQLLECAEWLDDVISPRMAWLTSSPVANLPYLMLIVVGVTLPVLAAMGQSIFLVCIAALIYCVALLTRDGRYVLASASVLSIASIGPVLQLAT